MNTRPNKKRTRKKPTAVCRGLTVLSCREVELNDLANLVKKIRKGQRSSREIFMQRGTDGEPPQRTNIHELSVRLPICANWKRDTCEPLRRFYEAKK